MNRKDYRIIKRIQRTIETFNLSLKGLKVLTEVGSNEYNYTPIIAAMAGADRVFAWTRDTQYGKAKDNIGSAQVLLKKLNLLERVEFYDGSYYEPHITQADVVTNSGFLRPLDSNKLRHVKPNVVIPLMYEKWELRPVDVDAGYCKRNGIKLAGTWENHPDILVFEHVGPLAVKLSLNAGFEIFRNNIVVWSNDNFGKVSSEAFKTFGASTVIQTVCFKELLSVVEQIDFIFICDYDEQRVYGDKDFFDVDALTQKNPSLGIVHLYGEIDYHTIQQKVAICYPKKNGKASVMTETLAHVGINPLIDLQVAGFKVGELLHNGKTSRLVQKV